MYCPAGPRTTSTPPHQWGPESRLNVGGKIQPRPLGRPPWSPRGTCPLHTQPAPPFLPAPVPAPREMMCTCSESRARALQPGAPLTDAVALRTAGGTTPSTRALGLDSPDVLPVTLTCCARPPSPGASHKLLVRMCPALEQPNPAVK